MKIDWKLLNNLSKGIEVDFDAVAAENYSNFITNRFFSKFPDTVLIANIMNEHHEFMTPEMNYLFYLNTVRPRYRYAKWGKSGPSAIDEKAVEIFMKIHNISRQDSINSIRLMTDEEITKMKTDWSLKYEQ